MAAWRACGSVGGSRVDDQTRLYARQPGGSGDVVFRVVVAAPDQLAGAEAIVDTQRLVPYTSFESPADYSARMPGTGAGAGAPDVHFAVCAGRVHSAWPRGMRVVASPNVPVTLPTASGGAASDAEPQGNVHHLWQHVSTGRGAPDRVLSYITGTWIA